jgi:hypothetical protein
MIAIVNGKLTSHEKTYENFDPNKTLYPYYGGILVQAC